MKTTLNQIARVLNVTLCIAAAAAFFVPNSNGQGITSSGISGAVTDSSGTPFSGVEISITHEPTGSVYTTQSNANGRFNLRGLRVGGPYTLNATTEGYGDYIREGLFLELSRTTSISINMTDAGEVVELASFTVVGDASLQYGASAAGAGSVIGREQLEETPALNRSFNDIARLDPRVSIMDGSVNAGKLVAAGQNNRMNSVQIDGVKINDQFGLEDDGNPSLANPISLETIDEIAIELSPYDVRQSGFMGASVNAVTKSGTNSFKGSVYHYFEGEDMRGNNPITGQKDVFEEKTTGFTLGGPILQNRLFFFVSYEELTRDVAGPTPGFIPDPNMVEQVRQKMI
ncbi:MAG: TonB-dependent receptor, partial [Verrucomicrobiota bacterium]